MIVRRVVALLSAAVVLTVVATPGAGASPVGWTSVPIPPAPHSDFQTTSDLACPEAGTCVAVGEFLATTSGGAVVSSVDPPTPAGGSDGELTSVSCWAVGECVAVGAYVAHFSRVGLIDTLTDGTWTATAALDVDGDPVLNGLQNVACSSVMCVASTENLAGQVLVRSADGTWQAQAVTSPTGWVLEPLQPSCAPSGTCFLSVNGRTPGFDYRPMFGYQSGSEWHAVLFPVPPDTQAKTLVLTSMTCPAAGQCLAFGSVQVKQGQRRLPVVERFAGGELAVTQLPAPTGTRDISRYDGGVDCSSVTHCVGYLRGNGLILYRLDGARWRFQTKTVNVLSPQEIACASTTCVITGFSTNATVLELDGTTWTIAHPPYPRTSPVSDRGELSAVSCASDACTLGGDAYNNRYGTSTPFVSFSG